MWWNFTDKTKLMFLCSTGEIQIIGQCKCGQIARFFWVDLDTFSLFQLLSHCFTLMRELETLYMTRGGGGGGGLGQPSIQHTKGDADFG